MHCDVRETEFRYGAEHSGVVLSGGYVVHNEISDKVVSFRVYGLWGVMDKQTGKVLIPAKYGNVEMVSKDIIKCSLESDKYDDYVLYDLKGNKIE